MIVGYIKWQTILIILVAGVVSIFILASKNESAIELDIKRGIAHNIDEDDRQQKRNYIQFLPLMNATRKFSFVHISKCAGSTWINTLGQQFDVCPQAEAGPEHSVWYQRMMACPNANYLLTSLRSPRHHVWSLFTECKYDTWGRKVTNHTGFPRGGNDTKSDEIDFDLWLDHFLPMGLNKRDMYECYHPANYQSRALTSRSKKPHGIGMDKFEPNITDALRTYSELDFVGITEFIPESLCLFYYRLGTTAPVVVRSFINDNCHCKNDNRKQDIIHVVHHELGHRSMLRDLPQDTLSKVDQLTVIDSELYIIALRNFMAEIAWLESSSELGRRVLCYDKLKRLEPELSYIHEHDGQNLNITQLYHNVTVR